MPESFDRLVSEIKPGIRKAHPDWDEDKVSSASYATATNIWKEKYGSPPRRENSEEDENNPNEIFNKTVMDLINESAEEKYG